MQASTACYKPSCPARNGCKCKRRRDLRKTDSMLRRRNVLCARRRVASAWRSFRTGALPRAARITYLLAASAPSRAQRPGRLAWRGSISPSELAVGRTHLPLQVAQSPWRQERALERCTCRQRQLLDASATPTVDRSTFERSDDVTACILESQRRPIHSRPCPRVRRADLPIVLCHPGLGREGADRGANEGRRAVHTSSSSSPDSSAAQSTVGAVAETSA